MRDSYNKQKQEQSDKLFNKLISFFYDRDNRVFAFLIAILVIISGLQFIENRYKCLIIPLLITILVFAYTLFLAKKDSRYKS
jgi:hypothetical protein